MFRRAFREGSRTRQVAFPACSGTANQLFAPCHEALQGKGCVSQSREVRERVRPDPACLLQTPLGQRPKQTACFSLQLASLNRSRSCHICHLSGLEEFDGSQTVKLLMVGEVHFIWSQPGLEQHTGTNALARFCNA